MGSDNVISTNRDLVNEARALRVQVLDVSLLIAVVVGGMAFARSLIDAIDREAWQVVGGSIVLYCGFIVLLVARRLPYLWRSLGFLTLMYVVGVLTLHSTGYLGGPILILACQSVLAAVLFGRRITFICLGLNLLAILIVGALLSSGLTSVETTTFYEPTVFINWLRVGTIFAVFGGIAVVSVDVITNHLNKSLRDQAELIENLKGAMQLRDAAESQRRQAESRLRDTQRNLERQR